MTLCKVTDISVRFKTEILRIIARFSCKYSLSSLTAIRPVKSLPIKCGQTNGRINRHEQGHNKANRRLSRVWKSA